MMPSDARGILLRQFDLAWKLLTHHLDGLDTADCMRRPAAQGLHVHHDVSWPGDAAIVRERIRDLHDIWRERLASLTEDELASSARTRWPFADRPFGDVVAWVNVELTKSAAEIGYVRFLYGANLPSQPPS